MTSRLIGVDDILRFPNPEADLRIAYGAEPLQFGDLRLPPPPGPHAVAMVIHGGCWRSRYDVSHIGSFSHALTATGIATWTIEYRRVGDSGGGWPGTFLDVAAALDRLRVLAPEHRLDLDSVISVGHSAGGHLALWVAARRKLPVASPIRGGAHPLAVKGVVSLAGVDDLRRAVDEGVCEDMAAQLLGGAPGDFGGRYREASPIELLPLGVPQHLMTGALDTIVPASFARGFAKKSRELGDTVVLSVLEDAGHFEVIAPGTSAFGEVSRAILAMAKR